MVAPKRSNHYILPVLRLMAAGTGMLFMPIDWGPKLSKSFSPFGWVGGDCRLQCLVLNNALRSLATLSPRRTHGRSRVGIYVGIGIKQAGSSKTSIFPAGVCWACTCAASFKSYVPGTHNDGVKSGPRCVLDDAEDTHDSLQEVLQSARSRRGLPFLYMI